MIGLPLLSPALSLMRDSVTRHFSSWRLSPIQTLALSFLLVILTGATLLTLPISRLPGVEVSLLDTLFTATSATTVTGLATVSTADTWSRFGQIVILVMIQIGGLGYMTIATVLALVLGVRVGLHTRLQLKESLGTFDLRDTIRVLRFIGIGAVLLEGIAALLLAARLHTHQAMPWGKAIFEGIFYAVSSFCNAGFDLAPGFQGLAYTPYRSDLFMLVIMGGLIIIGGLGFGVLAELDPFNAWRKRGRRRLGLHARIVLTMTALLIISGTALFLLFEWNNPASIGNDSLAQRLVTSWFMAVTPRTAGFSAVDLTTLSPLTIFMIVIFMIIGTAPGSTGGGVKVSTFAVIWLAVVALVQKRPDVEAFGRRIGGDTVRLAMSLFTVYITLVLVTIALIVFVEMHVAGRFGGPDSSLLFSQLAFEVVSAYGTVGLSTVGTPELSTFSRIVLMLAMFMGRMGPLTFVFIFAQPKRSMLRRLPTEPVIAG